MVAEWLSYIYHILTKHNFSVNNKMADLDWFKWFWKPNPTTIVRKAGGLSSARCRGLNEQDVSEGFLSTEELCRSLVQLTNENLYAMLMGSGVGSVTNQPKNVLTWKGRKAVHSKISVKWGYFRLLSLPAQMLLEILFHLRLSSKGKNDIQSLRTGF
jgi:hypothetical protein